MARPEGSGLTHDLIWAYKNLGKARVIEGGVLVLPEGQAPPSESALALLRRGLADEAFLVDRVMRLQERLDRLEERRRAAFQRQKEGQGSVKAVQRDPDDARAIQTAERFIKQALEGLE